MMFSQPQVGRGQTPQKPNILVIMLDDYDPASIALLAANGMMPNLMTYLLQTGTFFPDTFSVGGFGGPARASFLTGQYPQNHGVHGFQPDGGVERLNANSTVATWLKAAGYRTGHFGRYVTGYGWWTSRTAIPPGWDDWRTLVDPSSLNTVNYTVNVNGTIVDVGALAQQAGTELHQADVLAYAGNDFIRTAPQFGKPFFLVVAPAVFNLAIEPPFNACPGVNTPQYDPFYEGSSWGAAQRPAQRHLDTIWGDSRFALLRPPSFNEADVSDKPAWSWASRTGIFSDEIIDCIQKRNWRKFEGLRSVDDMIGWLMLALQETGALSNTVVIFTGDNGLIEGQHRVVGKGVPYDEANRVPLLIRTPGATQFRLIPKLVMSTDLAPTIAQLAGATPAHVPDGRSLVPLLSNPNAAWRRIGLIESIGDWDPFAERLLPPTFFAVRTDSTRPRFYARYTTSLDPANTGEMYDIAADPYQLQNRFYDPTRRAERDWLELWMTALRSCRGATCQYLESNFFWN
jgi:arylsulfatase A-like enzyme